MAEVAKVFSTSAKALYDAIVKNEWDPNRLSNPESVERLVKGDPELKPYSAGNKKLFDETYAYIKFLATQNFEVNEDNNYERQTDPLLDEEVARFRIELKRCFPEIDLTELTEDGIRDLTESEESPEILKDYVEFLTDGNQDLVENLYRATATLIQKQKYGSLNGFEDSLN